LIKLKGGYSEGMGIVFLKLDTCKRFDLD
jgi:hypothetical protein